MRTLCFFRKIKWTEVVEAVFPGLRHAYVVQPDDPRNGVPLTEIIRLLRSELETKPYMFETMRGK